MKNNTLILLAGVAVVLVGVAYWMTREGDASRDLGATGGKVFPGFCINGIEGFSLQAEGTTTVERLEGIWRVKEKYNYPADFDRVRELINKLADLKILRILRTTPQERADLRLLTPADYKGAIPADQKASILKLWGRNGVEIETLLIGSLHSVGPSESGAAGYPDGRFIMKGTGQVMQVADPLGELECGAGAWLDPEFIDVDASEIQEIWIEGITNGEVHVVRKTTDGDLQLQGNVPAGKEVDSAKMIQLASAWSRLQFDDLADPALPQGQTGLEQGASCRVRTTKGRVYTLRIGKQVGNQFYVKLRITGEAPETGKVAPSEAWIYLLSNQAVKNLTLGFMDMLKDKPAIPEMKNEQNKANGAPFLSGEK